MSKCEACPVLDGVCRGESSPWRFLCERAAKGDEVERRAIVGRPEAVKTADAPAVATAGATRPALPRRSGRRCWFKYQDPPCGCNGSRCHLRGGAAVTIYDCTACDWSKPMTIAIPGRPLQPG